MAMCFPMFPDQFRVIKVVRFEFQQKKSFLGLHTVVNWAYFGGVKGGGSDTNFFGLSIQFPRQLGPSDGKSSGPGRYLTFDTFWATLSQGPSAVLFYYPSEGVWVIGDNKLLMLIRR